MSKGVVLNATTTCAKYKLYQQSQAETNQQEYDVAYSIWQLWLTSTQRNMTNLCSIGDFPIVTLKLNSFYI